MNGYPCAKNNREWWLVAIAIAMPMMLFGQWLPKQSVGEWHVLLIAATSDEIAGSAHANSMQRAEQRISEMAHWMDLDLHIYRISGEAFTEEGVRKGVRQLIALPKPNQGKLMATVLTFTHGLNFEDTWTRLPFMVCHPTNYQVNAEGRRPLIAIEDIYHSLRAFGNFDHVHVWAELCNNIPYGLEEKAPNSQPMLDFQQNLQIGQKGVHLRKLLMGVPASLMVSASYGQISYAFKNAGGLFTASLLLALEKVGEGAVLPQFEGADGLFDFVKSYTQQQVQQLAGSMRQQTPQGYVGDIPREVPIPASNIAKTSEDFKRPMVDKEKKSALEMIEDLWKP